MNATKKLSNALDDWLEGNVRIQLLQCGHLGCLVLCRLLLAVFGQSIWHGSIQAAFRSFHQLTGLRGCSGEAACNSHSEKGIGDRWCFRVVPSQNRGFDCNSFTADFLMAWMHLSIRCWPWGLKFDSSLWNEADPSLRVNNWGLVLCFQAISEQTCSGRAHQSQRY